MLFSVTILLHRARTILKDMFEWKGMDTTPFLNIRYPFCRVKTLMTYISIIISEQTNGIITIRGFLAYVVYFIQ